MEYFALVASAVSTLVAIGAIAVSRIYYARTSRLVHRNEQTTKVLEKSMDQLHVMLNKLSHETDQAYGKLETGINQLSEAAQSATVKKSDPQQQLSGPLSKNGKHH